MNKRRPLLAARLKDAIEKAVGLSIADSVNLALFLLTLLSLALAFSGVWIAKATLDDARRSGEQQTRLLDQQISTLTAQTKVAEDSRSALGGSQGLPARLSTTDSSSAEADRAADQYPILLSKGPKNFEFVFGVPEGAGRVSLDFELFGSTLEKVFGRVDIGIKRLVERKR